MIEEPPSWTRWVEPIDWKARAEAAEKRIKELEAERAEGWKLRVKRVERPPLIIEDDDALEAKP